MSASDPKVLRWMAATLDGRVETSGAVFEAKFMLWLRIAALQTDP